VHRPALAAEWRNIAAINAAIVPDPSAVMRADASDVLILEGESYVRNAAPFTARPRLPIVQAAPSFQADVIE
jgi:hypothetical protein